jgi:hypothetical protein
VQSANAGIDSIQRTMKKNADGSVTVRATFGCPKG